ncbi:glycosyltransferase family 39 protein [Candidatus Woesearchaeota archaeon]|nr:glycosyltransferase family 39 protein [Candidatus Woesearchaeota archaeon]
MAEDRKDEHAKEKGFGEGKEVVRDAHPEEKDEKDIEINFNFGKVLSFFKKKASESPAAAKSEHRTEHHGSRSAEAEGKKEGEEAEIDIGRLASGIKGLFRVKREGKEKEKGEKPHGVTEGDEVSLDFNSIAEFLRKKGSVILPILGILIVIGLTADVRTQPSQLRFAEDWASNSVYNTMQNDIQGAINAQYPNLPDKRKSQILADEMNKARSSKTYIFKTGQYAGQQIDVSSQIKSTSEFIKDFYRDEEGRPYSPDIDPYYWNRYALNIVEKGHIGDEIRNGLEWDNHQVAPLGREISPQDYFFPYFIAYLYKFVRFFNHSVTLWEVQTMIYSVLFTSLTALLIFLIGRKIAGTVGGFFGALMAALHAAYVNRTIHGDNDQVVIFFAVLSVWLFVQAIHEHRAIWRTMLALFAGFSVALYSMAWGGWWFIFLFILSAAAAAILAGAAVSVFTQLVEGTKLSLGKTLRLILAGNVGKRFIMPTAVFFFSTAALITLFTGFNKFLETPLLALGVQTLKSPVVGASFWPNVLTTVAELNEGNFDQVVNSITPNIFWLSFLSAAMLTAVAITNFGFLKNKLKAIVPKEEKALYSVFFATLVVVWFAGTIYASTKGIRFVLLLAPMAGLGFGATLGLIFRLLMWINENFLKLNKFAAATAVFVMLATVTYSTDVTKKAYSIANNDVPIINDAWYGSLTAIQDDSKPDAIITSWWDFGHHFKSITDRRVTFDGTTQQYPPAHWVGKFFMTKNETEAAGILRMLDCGSTIAFDELNKAKNDFAATIKILYRLTATPLKQDAKTLLVLDYNLTQGQAENVLKYTHCTPPEAYVIASEDMIGKSGVWGHFGSWDFEKGIAWQTLKGKSQKEAVTAMKEMFNYSEEKAKATYNEIARIKDDREANSWIAPWPSFSGDVSGCAILASNENEQDKLVSCGNGLTVNLTTNDAYFPAQEGKVLHPISFVYMTNETGTEEFAERAYANDTVPQQLSVILVPQGEWLGSSNSYSSYYAAVASPEQAAGMFTRMFFMEGKGLKHFKLLTHNRGLTGTNVYVYKAQWDTLE